MARKVILFVIFAFCFLIFPSGSASAVSYNQTYLAGSFSSKYTNSSTGASGRFTKYQVSYPAGSAPFFSMDVPSGEFYSDPCFFFDGMFLGSEEGYVNYNISFVVHADVGLQIGSFNSFSDGIQSNVIDDIAIGYDSGAMVYSIAGHIKASASQTISQVCFGGSWLLRSTPTAALFNVVISRATINFYKEPLPSQSLADINNQQKQQFEQEQQQREEDKQASKDSGDNSQTSSEDSQSQVDEDSKNLFQILTEFVGAITNTQPSNCSIDADFGFFNAGNINLCTGASKFRPITTVVGTIMLIALTIPAIVTLLHRFMALYDEVID